MHVCMVTEKGFLNLFCTVNVCMNINAHIYCLTGIYKHNYKAQNYPLLCYLGSVLPCDVIHKRRTTQSLHRGTDRALREALSFAQILSHFAHL